jgi:spermidine/putrescine transport system substrate-binding protein
VAAGFVGLLALAGCTKDDKPAQPGLKGSASAAAAPEPPKPTPTEMSLLIFSEYIDEKIVADFEKDAKIRLRITTYESSEEMESKLSYGGADAQYDVVVAASQSLPRLVRKDLIRPLDHAKLPNLKNLDAKFSGAAFDDGNKHGAPYQWGTVGIMYDKKKHPKLDPSWSVVLDPKKVAGTFVLLDEMRDMVGAVLKYKGYSSNSTTAEQVREAGRILQEAKSHPKCLGFKGGVGAVQDVKAGSADIAVVWNGDALKEIDEDKERLTYVVPKEGSVMWVDAMMITKRAPSPELAHRFINFILDPDIGSRLSVYNRYASPNAAAKARLPAEDQANAVIYPAADMMGRLEYHRDLGTNQTVYDEVWTAVKAQ